MSLCTVTPPIHGSVTLCLRLCTLHFYLRRRTMSYRKTLAAIVALSALLLVTGCSCSTEQDVVAVTAAPAVSQPKVQTPTPVSSAVFTVEGETYYYVITSEDSIELRFQLTDQQAAAYTAAGNELFSELTEEVARAIDNEAVEAVQTVASHRHLGGQTVIYTADLGKHGINIP